MDNKIFDNVDALAFQFCYWTDNVDMFYRQLNTITKKDYSEYQPWLKIKTRNFFNNAKNEFKNNSNFLKECLKASDKVISIFDEQAINDLKNYYKEKNVYKDTDTIVNEYNSTKLDKLFHNKKYSDLIQVNFMLKVDSTFIKETIIPEALKELEKSNNEMER